VNEFQDPVRKTWLSRLPSEFFVTLSVCNVKVRDNGRPEILLITPDNYRNYVYDLLTGNKYIEAKKL